MKTSEFDGIQIKTIENVAFIIEHNFGADDKRINFHKQYIITTGAKMMSLAEDIFMLAKYANSIYPDNMAQYWERNMAIKKARAKIFSLLGFYQASLKILDVDDNKYTDHLRHLKHQANCMKNWLESDKETYKKKSWYDVKLVAL